MSALDDILTRLDRLEAITNAAGEATQPTYLTVDPSTGVIGAVFPGGVELPETYRNTTQLALPSGSLIWGTRQDSQGNRAEAITGGDNTIEVMTHNAPGGQDPGQALTRLRATDPTSNHEGLLEVSGDGYIDVWSDANKIRLIDVGGGSDFLRLVTSGKVAVQSGTSVVTTNAGPNGSLVINHSIGRIPIVVASADPSGAGNDIVVTVSGRTSTQFTLNVFAAGQGASWGYGVCWIAVG